MIEIICRASMQLARFFFYTKEDLMLRHNATIVVDIGYGDGGKGTMVDYIARNSPVTAVVRFNGGAQAAHNVHTPDGRHHTFAQFGSATFVPGVKTHLSRFMLVDVPALFNEETHLRALGVHGAFARLSIDAAALIVTPFHKASNRIREVLRGSGKHGSVGMGVGETMADRIAFPHRAVFAADLRSPETLIEKFKFFQKLKLDEFRTKLPELALDAALAQEVRLLSDPDAAEKAAVSFWRNGMRLRLVDGSYLARLALEGDLVFEGAQGVLIDEWHGFHPFTTWSTVTPDNARMLLAEIGYTGSIKTLGVLRAYATRHGAGPFPTEAVQLTTLLPDTHNTFGRWQENFRVGHFDAVLSRYAIAACGGIDSLAVTNLDRVAGVRSLKVATSYEVTDVTRSERDSSIGTTGSGSVTSITSFRRKPFLSDLRYQETLTGIVLRATPAYVPAPEGDAFVRMIERELKTPVSITSHGPASSDKRRREPIRLAA
jgi:adenylosuccinate synthase